ncbi:MAG: hypothetical protein RLZZ297_314 [Chloroflexota bacterium]
MMKRLIERLNDADGWIGIIIGVVTVYAGFVGMLQVHAGNLNTDYRAQTQRLSLDAMRIRSVGEATVSANLAYGARVEDLLTQQQEYATLNDDTAAAETYASALSELAVISPAYAEPYAGMGDKGPAAYVVDTYLRDATRADQLRSFMQALDMAWDTKANTYIVHLTLLAVVLGLLGLSLVMSDIPRLMIFSTAMVMTLITAGWTLQTYREPLPVYEAAAVDAFVEGYTLAYQDDNAGAITAYDKAIAALPTYGDAHYERALILYSQEKYPEALAGFAAARAAGYDLASVDAWQAYLALVVGDIAQARSLTDAWVAREPKDPSALGAAIAVAGAESDPAAVTAAAQTMRTTLTTVVAELRAKGSEPDEDFLFAIDEYADVLQELRDREPALIQSPEMFDAVDAAIADVRSLGVTLAFGLTPGSGTVTGIQLGTKDESGAFFAASDFSDESFDGIPLTIAGDAAGVPQGAHVLVKFFVDDTEDESLRYVGSWEQASDGPVSLDVPIDLGPSYVLPAGTYAVELYVDGVLQEFRTEFIVE